MAVVMEIRKYSLGLCEARAGFVAGAEGAEKKGPPTDLASEEGPRS